MQPLIAVPAVAILVLRAYSNNSLTPLGIVVAALTAVVHAIHPWSIFFALLVVFFLGGTAVTKVLSLLFICCVTISALLIKLCAKLQGMWQATIVM